MPRMARIGYLIKGKKGDGGVCDGRLGDYVNVQTGRHVTSLFNV